MLYKLKLDHDRVYWGAELINQEDVKDGDVVLDHVPDNPPGKYVWKDGRMEPLPPGRQRSTDAPTTERALYEFWKHLHERDAESVPKVIVEWCIDYERSWDAQLDDGLDAGAVNKLAYFRGVAK